MFSVISAIKRAELRVQNLDGVAVYFCRAQTIIKQCERIKRMAIEHRRLEHSKLTA